MFDVILDDKNSSVIIVLTFQDYVEEKELNPSYVFPNPKDAQRRHIQHHGKMQENEQH